MKNPFRGRGMDIFWNHTLLKSSSHDQTFINPNFIALIVLESLKLKQKTCISSS